MKWLFPSIYSAQIRHHGFWRATMGGLLMYCSIPFFVLLDFILAKAVMPVLMGQSVDRPKLDDFIHYRRDIMDELIWFDQFNCLFCSWANGIVEYLNVACDHVLHQKRSGWSLSQRAALLGCGSILIFTGLYITIINRSIAYFHSWTRLSLLANWRDLRTKGYGAAITSGFARETMFLTKFVMIASSHSLKQIETRWCPIRYVETRRVPAHHDLFLSQVGVKEIAEHLAIHGKFG